VEQSLRIVAVGEIMQKRQPWLDFCFQQKDVPDLGRKETPLVKALMPSTAGDKYALNRSIIANEAKGSVPI
jgi:hypothetical protein